jgi:hypothetical protein
MNRPRDRRRNPNHPHNMMLAKRKDRRILRWLQSNPRMRAWACPEACLDDTPPKSKWDKWDEEKFLADWIDTNRWGIDMDEHPEIHAEIQALAA